jgi:plastocyanin
MHARLSLFALAASVLFVSCGGGGGSSTSTPTAPSNSSSGGSAASTAVTINIIGDRGALSFSPNPATVPAGQTVVWKNTDTVAHHIVIDGLVNTGDLAPGASSAPQALGAVEKGYHCSIHPGMVGSLNNAATPDPCTDYGYGCR